MQTKGLPLLPYANWQKETGLRVSEKDLQLKHANINNTDASYINIVFDVSSWQGVPRIMEPDKCDDMQFFALDALPAKCTLAVRYVERAGFDTQGITSYVDRKGFKELIGTDIADIV